MGTLAVVVTCHGAYLPWLGACLASIDAQGSRLDDKVVVFDGCEPPSGLPRGWRVVRGAWSHPSPARNAGLAATSAPWVVHWDADNVMAPGHLRAVERAVGAAGNDVGIVYADLQLVDERLARITSWTVPAFDHWSLRAENYIDTASAWRREAVEVAGGWSTRVGAFEDWALALDITAQRWRAVRRDGPPVLLRVHEGSRMRERQAAGGAATDLWRARTQAVVSLLAGREATFPRWERFLRTAELPPRTSLYVVENSGRPSFTKAVLRACERIAAERDLEHVDVASVARRYVPAADEPYFVRERHLHIARLYAEVLGRVREDLVLTLEDDVEPPPSAIRQLGEAIGCTGWGRYGAVAAAYDMGDAHLCAGRDDGGWGSPITWGELPDHPLDVGSVGGGCTMWAGWALAATPPAFHWDAGLGWDGTLCAELRRQGYGVRLHGGVRCTHHVHGMLRSEQVGAAG